MVSREMGEPFHSELELNPDRDFRDRERWLIDANVFSRAINKSDLDRAQPGADIEPKTVLTRRLGFGAKKELTSASKKLKINENEKKNYTDLKTDLARAQERKNVRNQKSAPKKGADLRSEYAKVYANT